MGALARPRGSSGPDESPGRWGGSGAAVTSPMRACFQFEGALVAGAQRAAVDLERLPGLEPRRFEFFTTVGVPTSCRATRSPCSAAWCRRERPP